MKRCLVAAGLVAAALLVVGAASADTPGVSSNSILLGGTSPITGEAALASSVASGANAYFEYVNSKGGVFGRKITYKIVDDGYDPSKTVEAVRGLVQQDNVFAIFASLGTEPNLAIRDFLNQSKVPQLLVASGAHTFGADYARYPWTIGYIPSYITEGTIYGQYLARTSPRAKIGVLYQDDAYGQDLVAGLTKGLGSKAGQIVAKVGYDPASADVQSQVAQLKASGANVLCIFAFGKFAIQAFVYADKLGWHPPVIVNDVASAASAMSIAPVASSQGAVSIAFGKDPTDPSWRTDRGILLYRLIMKAFCSGCDAQNPYYVAGMAEAYTLVDALRKAGRDLTRDGVMKAVTSLNEPGNPFLLPGIVVSTTATQRFPITQVQLQRWSKGTWHRFGPLLNAPG
jgi:branched-chain amino acid transport system substrate-binding protein